MKHKTCPQCGITNFYLKDNSGNRLLVKISEEGEVIPKNTGAKLEDFNTDVVYCLGCSWSGPLSKLI